MVQGAGHGEFMFQQFQLFANVFVLRLLPLYSGCLIWQAGGEFKDYDYED